MFEKVLVAKNIEAGNALLAALAKWNFPVTAAFWIYSEEADDWKLVIISPFVATPGPRESYGILAHALYDLKHDPTRPIELSMESVSLLSPENSLYKHMQRLANEGPLVFANSPNVTRYDTYVYRLK